MRQKSQKINETVTLPLTQESAEKPLSSEDWHKEVDRQTSFQRYSMALLRTLGIVLTGAAIGALSFNAFKNREFIQKSTSRLLEFFKIIDPTKIAEQIANREQSNPHHILGVGGFTGGVAGYIISKIVNGYKSFKSDKIQLSIIKQINSRSLTRTAAVQDIIKRQQNAVGEIEQRLGIENPASQLEQAGAVKQAGSQIIMG